MQRGGLVTLTLEAGLDWEIDKKDVNANSLNFCVHSNYFYV